MLRLLFTLYTRMLASWHYKQRFLRVCATLSLSARFLTLLQVTISNLQYQIENETDSIMTQVSFSMLKSFWQQPGCLSIMIMFKHLR